MIEVLLQMLADPSSITPAQITNVVAVLIAAAAIWIVRKLVKDSASAETDEYYQERVRELAEEKKREEREKAEEARVKVVR